jgi:O-acetylserine/cysteine efflux transporter
VSTAAGGHDAARSLFGPGDAIMLATVMMFGSTFPVAKPLMAVMDPFLFAFTRFLIAGTLLFAVLRLRGRDLSIARADVPELVLLGCIGFAMFSGLWGLALSLTIASKAAIIMATSPAWGALIATVRGQPAPPLAWAGLALAFAGVALVINNSFAELTIGGGTFTGDIMWVGLAFLWALYSNRVQAPMAKHGPTKTLAWAMLFGSLLLSPIGIWGGLHQDFAAIAPHLWINYAYQAVVAAAIAMLTYNVAVRLLGVTRAIVYMYLVPVFAVIISVIFLGERFTAAMGVGALCVLTGIALTQYAMLRVARGGARRPAP